MAFAALLATSCGDDTGARRFTLRAETGGSQGLWLDTGMMVADVQAATDLRLTLGMELSLTAGHPDGGLCRKGSGASGAEDIDAGVATCAWIRLVRLRGNAPDLEGYPRDDAYLVRTAALGVPWRLLILDDAVGDDGFGTITLDVLPVD